MFKEKLNQIQKEKVSPTLVILAITQVVVLLISNIIAAKTFPLFTIGDLQIVLPCAVFLYPIVYVLSDIISEVFKFKWSRRVCWTSFAMNLLMVICFEIAIAMPGETDLSVLSSTWFLLISSLLSFMVGGWVNDVIFKKMKSKTQGKGLTGRILVSSIFGQLTDSLIYIPLAMNIFPSLILGFPFMTWAQEGICVLIQPTFKVIIDCIVAPFTRWACKKLNKLEAENGNVYGSSEENFNDGGLHLEYI